MQDLVYESRRLERRSPLRIENGRGTLVYVWGGGLWITQEGDSRDRYVGPGGWLRIESDGLTLASALGEGAEVALSRPARRATWRARLEKLWRSDEPATAAS